LWIPRTFNHTPAELFQTLIQRLKNFLEDDDTSATDVLEELLQASQGPAIDALLHKIQLAVGNYDFESALALMKEVSI